MVKRARNDKFCFNETRVHNILSKSLRSTRTPLLKSLNNRYPCVNILPGKLITNGVGGRERERDGVCKCVKDERERERERNVNCCDGTERGTHFAVWRLIISAEYVLLFYDLFRWLRVNLNIVKFWRHVHIPIRYDIHRHNKIGSKHLTAIRFWFLKFWMITVYQIKTVKYLPINYF